MFAKLQPGQPAQKDVLALVNKMRKAAGLSTLRKLPKGKLRRSKSCPLAVALNFDMQVTQTTLIADIYNEESKKALAAYATVIGAGRTEDGRLLLPPRLAAFVDFFDRNCYPSLIDRGL